MYYAIAFIVGVIAGGITMYFVGKKHGSSIAEVEKRLKDTFDK